MTELIPNLSIITINVDEVAIYWKKTNKQQIYEYLCTITFMEQKLQEMQGNTLIIGDFNSPHPIQNKID